MEPTTVPGDRDSIEIDATVGDRPRPKERIVILAKAGELERQAEVELEIQSPVTLPTPGPAGAVRPIDDSMIVAIRGKKYYDKIDLGLADGSTVRFLLIPWQDPDQRPFYIMEHQL